MTRVTPRLATSPMAAPSAINFNPIDATIRCTSPRDAPEGHADPDLACVCRDTV